MNLNKLINIFNSSGLNSVRKSDFSDTEKKNNVAVKLTKTIFDSNLDGKLDESELEDFDKAAMFDSETEGVSVADFRMFGALTASVGDLTLADTGILKLGRYSYENNVLNTFDSNQKKLSSTTINNDGTITKTAFGSNNTKTISEFTADYKLVSKTEIAFDGSSLKTLYNEDGKPSLVTSKSPQGAFVSEEEYEYDDYGNKESVTTYDENKKITDKILYIESGEKIKVKYDSNEEIIKRDTYDRALKQLSSFEKNPGGSYSESSWQYSPNGETTKTIKSYSSEGLLQSEAVSKKDRRGNQEIKINGVLTQKDVVNSDNTIKSTMYSAENIIDRVISKDAKGNTTQTDYYTYENGNIKTIVRKDSQGNLLATGVYDYSNPSFIKSLDHFDANGVLLDKSIWNLDGTKTVIKYNTSISNKTGTLTESYGTDNKLTETLFTAQDGSKIQAAYLYNTPSEGDSKINTTYLGAAGNPTGIEEFSSFKDGSSEKNTYNSDKTRLLEKLTGDKYGSTLKTVYNENNQIASTTKTLRDGTVTAQDVYTYTNDKLSLVNHLSGGGKLLGKTVYDENGNLQGFDNLNRITSSRTKDLNEVLTVVSYQYSSNGDKIVKTTTVVNGKRQTYKIANIRMNNSADITTYSGDSLIILQKDQVDKDGKTKSTIYDPVKKRVSSVINKDANNNIIAKNQYNYSSKGLLEYIESFDSLNKIVKKIQYAENLNRTVTSYDQNGNITNITLYDRHDNVLSSV